MFPITGTVGVRKRRTGETDAHGNPVVTFADPVPVGVYGWGPRMSSESTAGRDEVIVGLTVYGPPGLDITALDRIDVPFGGATYEVDGETGDWNHGPFGWTPGVSIALKRVSG